MPYTQMSLEDAAEYLHLSEKQIEKLARQGEFPFRYAQRQLVFEKRQLHVWATLRFIDGDKQCPLKDFHQHATSVHSTDSDRAEPFLIRFVHPETVSTAVNARTKSRVLRELVKLAAASDQLADDAAFLNMLEAREDICATGLENGVAMPHSQVHNEYLFMESVLVIAHVPDGVPFGAPDGKKTDLFIMPCANNDRIHLYMISRLALLLTRTDLADELRNCDTNNEMIETLERIEAQFVDSQNDE